MPRNPERDALRTSLRRERASLTPEQVARAAEALARRLSALPEYAAARSVAAYLAMPGEMDPMPAMQRARAAGKAVYVPVIAGKRLSFAPWSPTVSMRRGAFGILEPEVAPELLIHAAQVELVLVPLLGFDSECNRLGMGGGFYDRSFASRLHGPGPSLVGIAHESQKIPHLESQAWDVPLDAVLTDCDTYRRLNQPEPPAAQ